MLACSSQIGHEAGSFHDREKTGGVPFLTLRTCGVRRLEVDLPPVQVDHRA
jgi:hypothetical protein